MKDIVVSTAYFPTVAWFQQVLAANEIWLEKQENYTKQTYRNRCKILSTHGVQDLSIPLQHTQSKIKITEIVSDESQDWKRVHWQAIQSAYGKSPYFIHYAWRFEPYYKNKEVINLYAFNFSLIQEVFKALKLSLNLKQTESFEPVPSNKIDLRNAFHAKGTPRQAELIFEKRYYQSFPEKQDFVANLCILDLLFHQGPDAVLYLISPTN
jgi:hypothetical protein